MFYPLSAINLNILNVKGRSDIFLYLEIAKKTLIVLAIVATLSGTVIHLLVGLLTATVLGVFLNLFYSGRVIRYSWQEQLSDILPYGASALLIAGLTYLLSLSVPVGNLLLLALLTVFSVGSYALVSRWLKFDAYMELETLVKEYLIRGTKKPGNT